VTSSRGEYYYSVTPTRNYELGTLDSISFFVISPTNLWLYSLSYLPLIAGCKLALVRVDRLNWFADASEYASEYECRWIYQQNGCQHACQRLICGSKVPAPGCLNRPWVWPLYGQEVGLRTAGGLALVWPKGLSAHIVWRLRSRVCAWGLACMRPGGRISSSPISILD